MLENIFLNLSFYIFFYKKIIDTNMKNKITRKIYYKLWTKKAKRINISVLLLQQINVKNRKLIATLIIKREGLLPI